jgi:hypothetical protein
MLKSELIELRFFSTRAVDSIVVLDNYSEEQTMALAILTEFGTLTLEVCAVSYCLTDMQLS